MCLVKDNKKQEQAWTSGLGVVTKVTPLLKSLRTAQNTLARLRKTGITVVPSDIKLLYTIIVYLIVLNIIYPHTFA